MKITPRGTLLAGCLAVVVGMSVATEAHRARTATIQDARARFVGAWRLVSLEHTGPDGTVDKPECSGQFLFTADGHAAVQVMYRNAHAGDAYAESGYEATFGRYTVDEQTSTFTFQVDGALVRTLVGQNLPRRYTFTGTQLIVEPANQVERWRVVWARE